MRSRSHRAADHVRDHARGGAAYIATSSLVMTSIQAAVPGYLRGRVMALFMMFVHGRDAAVCLRVPVRSAR